MKNFKMDRTVTSKSSFLEANDHTTFYIDKSALERLNHACFIINNIFKTTTDHKVNRKIIFSRKHA